MKGAADLCLVTILLCYESPSILSYNSLSLQDNFQNTFSMSDVSARDGSWITLGQNVTFESKLEKLSLLS